MNKPKKVNKKIHSPNHNSAIFRAAFGLFLFSFGLLISFWQAKSWYRRQQVAGVATSGSYAVRSDGVILADGQPFFPFGFYHTSWMTDKSGAKRRGQAWIQDLTLMANNGFNFVHPTFDFGQDNHDFARLALERNVKILVGVGQTNIGRAIDAFKTYPNVMGYDIADDFDKYESPTLLPFRDLVRQKDPNRLVYGSASANAGKFDWAGYNQVFDVMGVQAYPVGNWSETSALEVNVWYNDLAKKGTPQNVALMGVPQAFAWSTQYPTPVEARNLTYGALIIGVKGLIPYAFFPSDSSNNVLPEGNPALWQEYVTLKKEIDTFTPALLDGVYNWIPTEINKDKPTWHAAYWKYQNAVYLVILNTHRTESKSVSFALPENLVGFAPAFSASRYGATLTYVNKTITGAIKPGEVQVYTAQIAPATSPTPKPSASPTVRPSPLASPTVQPSPSASPTNVEGTPGLRGLYYNNPDFTQYAFTRIDSKLNFNWKFSKPHANLDRNTYSVRWEGYLIPPYSGQYTLTARVDDGVKIWINDELVLDQWSDGYKNQSFDYTFQANRKYRIKIEYYDNNNGAQMRLYWKHEKIRFQIIGQKYFRVFL